MEANYKSPPLLKEDSSYEYGKRKLSYGKYLQILMLRSKVQQFTYHSLEVALELSAENLNSDTGVVQLLAKLDELYLKNKDQHMTVLNTLKDLLTCQ